MKTNRLVTLVVIALLAIGAVGAVSLKVFAQSVNPLVQTQTIIQPENGTTETQSKTDTDNVEMQSGDQNAIGNVEVQSGDQYTPEHEQGSEEKEVNENQTLDSQDPVPAGTPAITAEVAQKAAEAYLNAGTATKVQLDDENGKLVYSVEFPNGTDVKVDAMTGNVLGADAGQD